LKLTSIVNHFWKQKQLYFGQ